MSSHSLIDQVEEVTSLSTFVKFLSELSNDFRQNGSLWENRNLNDFLEALHDWSDDCVWYYKNMNLSVDPDEAQWRVFADMLLAARVYE